MAHEEYLKKKLTGENLSLEERVHALLEGGMLSAFGMLYVPIKSLSNAKEFFTGEQISEFNLDPSLSEYFGAIAECYSAMLKGKFKPSDKSPEEIKYILSEIGLSRDNLL